MREREKNKIFYMKNIWNGLRTAAAGVAGGWKREKRYEDDDLDEDEGLAIGEPPGHTCMGVGS